MQGSPQRISAGMNASGLKIAIVASRFNQMLVDQLVDGAMDTLVRHGAHAEDQMVVFVPGAWEIPLIAKKLASQGRYHGVICVGVLVKGSTHHFDFIAGGAVDGIARASLETGIPITMGLLTTDTVEQAMERSGMTMGNQGSNAALAAIELCNLMKRVESL